MQSIASPLTKYFRQLEMHTERAKDGIYVYTDGSAIGNGKKDATGGYGVFFSDPTIPPISEKITPAPNAPITNGLAELMAVVAALQYISVHLNETTVVIYYDSEYAADVLLGRKKAHKHVALVQRGKDFIKECPGIQFRHVYSHTGADDLHSIGNDIADKLAKGK